ncbi:MAG: hypothetical protein U9R32_09185 [Bacteroidota bacterium]|nr:hypothetical protein [Bacteroidota bacterium]
MENITGFRNNVSEKESLITLSSNATNNLAEIGEWGKFLSVVGFCFIGLIIVGGILMGLFFSVFSSSLGIQNQLPFHNFGIILIYLVIGVVYFYPIYFLYNFSTNIKAGLKQKNEMQVDKAFKNLKSHYKFIGILTIIFLALYAVLFLLGILGSLVI